MRIPNFSCQLLLEPLDEADDEDGDFLRVTTFRNQLAQFLMDNNYENVDTLNDEQLLSMIMNKKITIEIREHVFNGKVEKTLKKIAFCTE